MRILLDCRTMMPQASSPSRPLDTVPAPDELAALFKACGEPLRLEILRVLRGESFGVQELCTVFDVHQPTMSHHLKVLAKAGLVATRREGNSIFYRRHHQAPCQCWQSLWGELLQAADDLPLPPQQRARVEQVYRDRARSSRQFFEENSHRLGVQQELIASHQEYATPVRDLLESAGLPGHRLALEIGPGEGAFLEELSRRFERVVAVDISDAMLALARSRALQLGLDNIEFLHGDSSAALTSGLRADCIVLHMVLHHTPSPADMLADLAAMLLPGGSLFLSELCRHDQTWAREACGDIWLGFEPDDITRWAADAGLETGRQLYFSQRNGFSVQIRQFLQPSPGAEVGPGDSRR